MKKIIFILSSILFSLMLLSSCGDEEDIALNNPLIGHWTGSYTQIIGSSSHPKQTITARYDYTFYSDGGYVYKSTGKVTGGSNPQNTSYTTYGKYTYNNQEKTLQLINDIGEKKITRLDWISDTKVKFIELGYTLTKE